MSGFVIFDRSGLPIEPKSRIRNTRPFSRGYRITMSSEPASPVRTAAGLSRVFARCDSLPHGLVSPIRPA